MENEKTEGCIKKQIHAKIPYSTGNVVQDVSIR
jgi:hypothetical protein